MMIKVIKNKQNNEVEIRNRILRKENLVLTDGGAIFRSKNSTSMINLPVKRVSTAHTKSSLFLSCLSQIPAQFKAMQP